jgi:carbonic anhydrase
MPQPQTPEQAWTALCQGNARFVTGHPEHPRQDRPRPSRSSDRRGPFALILSCMNSWVCPEILFDQGIGDLAVVRSAGQVLDSAGLGSLEYGVETLAVPLLVVLGHQDCGVMVTTLRAHTSGERPCGNVRTLVERITPSLGDVRRAGTPLKSITPDLLAVAHVRRTVRLLVEWSPVLARHVGEGTCAIAGADYRLTDGSIELLEAVGDIGEAVGPTSGLPRDGS